MSKAETDFKEAKKSLQFSTSLLEKMRQPPQQMSEPPIEQPQTPQNGAVEQPVEEVPQEPQEEQKETKTIISGVIDGLKDFFTKKDEEPKEVTLKQDATVEPKEDS